tara:strand:- start:5900 stop:6310 length:411 start_codon:yes stop_codon:yes gene_type:complete
MKLKKAPNKGVTQLPKDVRNKMGFMSKGGAVKVKYKGGGVTPTENTMTKDIARQTAAEGNQPNADYSGYKKPKTPKEVLEASEMSRLTAALKKGNYGTKNMSLADMRNVAKTKGLYDDALSLAREDYQKEMDNRKG